MNDQLNSSFFRFASIMKESIRYSSIVLKAITIGIKEPSLTSTGISLIATGTVPSCPPEILSPVRKIRQLHNCLLDYIRIR